MRERHHKFLTLNLTQQLVGIILLFVVIFLSFFFVYLNRNINDFVRVEMESVLSGSQESIVENYLREHDGKFLENSKDKTIAHKILDSKRQYQTESYRYLPADIRNQINLKHQQMLIQEKSASVFEVLSSDDYVLASISIDQINEFTVISTLNKTYKNEFRARLINSILNAIFVIVFILFALMLAWVTSIIRSLNKIQDYVDKVAKGESLELNIYRQDEIGQVAKALVYMNEELAHQEKVKEELIQNISHDLKTPIATIKSYGESIKDGIYPYDTLEKSVDVIIEHAGRLEQKVHSLLLLNRMEYLVSNSEGLSIDLENVVKKSILSIIPVRPDIEIISELQPAIFKGEEESWRVVCENILDNALRYAKTYIKIILDDNSLSFENDGEQLSSSEIKTMFKPYEKGSDGGFGMGLSIVNRVVSAYGYQVYAQNTKNGVIIKIEKKPQ